MTDLAAYEAAYAALLVTVTEITTDLDDLLAANAMRRYDRGAVIADFVDRYAEYGDQTVARLAADRRLHPATLYEDMRIYRAFPDREGFAGLVRELRSWSRITRSLAEAVQQPPKSLPEAAARVDRACFVLEETGRLIEQIKALPPGDNGHRQETAGALLQLGRDAIETALTLDPALVVPATGEDSSGGESSFGETSTGKDWGTELNMTALNAVPRHPERTDGLYPQLVDMLWLARRTGAYMAANWLQDGIEGLIEGGTDKNG